MKTKGIRFTGRPFCAADAPAPEINPATGRRRALQHLLHPSIHTEEMSLCGINGGNFDGIKIAGNPAQVNCPNCIEIINYCKAYKPKTEKLT